MRYYIFLYSFIFLFSSCFNNKQEDDWHYEYYPNGNVKIRYEMKDSLVHGKAEYFTEDGKLDKTREYENEKLNGWEIIFDKNGNKRFAAEYINDKHWGDHYVYFANGSIFQYSFRNAGEKYGYLIEYDSLGNEKFREGQIIQYIICQPYNCTIEVGEVLNIYIETPNPPYCKKKVVLNSIFNKGTGRKTDVNEEIKIKNKMATISYQLEKSGDLVFEYEAYLIDTLNDTVYSEIAKKEILVESKKGRQ